MALVHLPFMENYCLRGIDFWKQKPLRFPGDDPHRRGVLVEGAPKEMWEIGNSYFKFFVYALLDMQEKETGKLG